jgi:hypothetical protein
MRQTRAHDGEKSLEPDLWQDPHATSIAVSGADVPIGMAAVE